MQLIKCKDDKKNRLHWVCSNLIYSLFKASPVHTLNLIYKLANKFINHFECDNYCAQTKNERLKRKMT